MIFKYPVAKSLLYLALITNAMKCNSIMKL